MSTEKNKAGRPSLYGEPTKSMSLAVPVSQHEHLVEITKRLLKTYEIKRKSNDKIKPRKKARNILDDFIKTTNNFDSAKNSALLHLDIIIDFCIDNELKKIVRFYLAVYSELEKIDTPF